MYSRSTPTSVLAILFDLALDGARDVESPSLLPSMKAQALERYRKLSAPALLGATRSFEPDAIPLFLDWTVFDDKRINERSARCAAEELFGFSVAEAIGHRLRKTMQEKLWNQR